MSAQRSKIVGAVVGSFVGDALSLGSHWHYDLKARDQDIYPGGIAGFDTPVAGHYHEGREPGDLTHYGDAALVLLLSICRHRGFRLDEYADEFVNYFKLYNGYLDKSTKTVLSNAETAANAPFFGGSDDQTGGMTRNGLAALVTPEDELDQTMVDICKVTQSPEEIQDGHRFHGRLLKALISGIGIEEAVALAADQTASDFVQAALDEANGQDHPDIVDATGSFGRACYLKSTLPACLHAVLRKGDDPKACLFEIVRAGGDNAARAMVAGCWLGAAHGIDAWPNAWLDKLNQRDEILTLADQLAALAE